VNRLILATDVLCLSITGLLVWLAIVRLWKRSVFRLTFSLLGLFVGVLILAIILAWLTNTYREWRIEQRLIAETKQRGIITRTDYAGPEWLRRLIDKRTLGMFWRVTWVDGVRDDDDLEVVGNFSHLCDLKLAGYSPGIREGSNVSDVGLSYLANCRELRKFVSQDGNQGKITDCGLNILVKLRNLQVLDLRNASTTDTGIRGLKDLPNLKSLLLCNTPVTDASLDTLQQIHSLRSLDLTRCIQIRNLDRLFDFPKLDVVYLSESQRNFFSKSVFRNPGTPQLHVRFNGQESWLRPPLEERK